MAWFAEITHYPIQVKAGIGFRNLVGLAKTVGPTVVVLDCSGTSDRKATLDGYVESKSCPHITIFPETKEVMQHIDYDEAAPVSTDPRGAHRRGNVLWVNVAKSPSESLNDEDTVWVGSVVGGLVDAVGAGNRNHFRSTELTLNEWDKFNGLITAAAVPFAGRYGIGVIDPLLFIEGSILGERLEEGDYEEGVEEDVSVGETEVFELPEFKGKAFGLGSASKKVQDLATWFNMPADFNEEMEEKIKEIQSDFGLEPNGIVDSDTWDAIRLSQFNEVSEDAD